MIYPTTPPKTENNVQINPKYIDLFRSPSASGISNKSGGIGKNEASAKAIPPKAFTLFGLFARDKTQLYMLRMKFIQD